MSEAQVAADRAAEATELYRAAAVEAVHAQEAAEQATAKAARLFRAAADLQDVCSILG